MFRIRIRFLRIRILDFSPNPDPSRQQKTNFSKAKTKFWEKFLFSTQKFGILFLFSTNHVGILLNRERLFGIIIWYGNLNPDPTGSGSETLFKTHQSEVKQKDTFNILDPKIFFIAT